MRISTVFLQAGMRAMVARSEYRNRRQVKAAKVIQVSSWIFIQMDQCFIAVIIFMSLKSGFLSNLFPFSFKSSLIGVSIEPRRGIRRLKNHQPIHNADCTQKLLVKVLRSKGW